MLCEPDCPGSLCCSTLKLPTSALFLALKSQKALNPFPTPLVGTTLL